MNNLMNTPHRHAPFAAALFAALLFAGCESGGPPTSDKDLKHIEYRQVVQAIAESTERRPVVLVDVRTPEQFAKGHIDGAINLPLADLNPRDTRLVKVDKVIVYHEDFKGAYADVAAKKLISSGVVNVFSYAGGYKDWVTRKTEGVPVPPSDPSAEPKK